MPGGPGQLRPGGPPGGGPVASGGPVGLGGPGQQPTAGVDEVSPKRPLPTGLVSGIVVRCYLRSSF